MRDPTSALDLGVPPWKNGHLNAWKRQELIISYATGAWQPVQEIYDRMREKEKLSYTTFKRDIRALCKEGKLIKRHTERADQGGLQAEIRTFKIEGEHGRS